MTSGRSILCPVDFSEGSRAALCYAVAIADHFGARLTVMTVDDPVLVEAAAVAGIPSSFAAESESELRRFFAEVLPHEAAAANAVEFRETIGKPATEILRAAQAVSADLIVISSHGQSGVRRMFFGSTTERVLRETTTPVLITPDTRPAAASFSEMAGQIHRVLVPIDLTPASHRLVAVAGSIAEALAVPLIVTYVLEPIFVPSGVRRVLPGADIVRRAQVDSSLAGLERSVPPGVSTEYVVSTGEPAEEIVRLAQTRGANLIVMGLHSGGSLSPSMGAVTYRVVSVTRALVLALPPVPSAGAAAEL